LISHHPFVTGLLHATPAANSNDDSPSINIALTGLLREYWIKISNNHISQEYYSNGLLLCQRSHSRPLHPLTIWSSFLSPSKSTAKPAL